MRYFETLLLILLIAVAGAQDLKPSITSGNLAADTDSICEIPLYLGSFETSGYQVNDTVADFSLFTNEDVKYHLGTLLSTKPVLLVSSSYTCPVFRNKIPLINQLQDSFGNDVHILVVYTVEAHPQIDTSPYFGYVNTGSQNNNQGILYRQPTTYGERKAIVDDLLTAQDVAVPVIIDGTCNEWWNAYGPAPNNATLIDTNGIVFAKHGWLDRFPEDISCDIQRVLGQTSSCDTAGTNGSFSFEMISSDTIYGSGGVLTIDAELTNAGSEDVLVFVKRLQNNLPGEWTGSLCIDICYGTDDDSTTVLIKAGITQHFSFYFYPTDLDTGHVRVGFRNVADNSNSFVKNFFGINQATSSVQEMDVESKLFPNPLMGQFLYCDGIKPDRVFAIHLNGQRFELEVNENIIDATSLRNGLWTVQLIEDAKVRNSRILVLK